MRLGRRMGGSGKSWGKGKQDQNILYENIKLKRSIQLKMLEQEVTLCHG